MWKSLGHLLFYSVTWSVTLSVQFHNHLQFCTVSAVLLSHLQFCTVTCSFALSLAVLLLQLQFYLAGSCSEVCDLFCVCDTLKLGDCFLNFKTNIKNLCVWHDSLFDCSVDTALHTRLTDAGTGDAAATELETATSVSAPGRCGSWARWGEGGRGAQLFVFHRHEPTVWCVLYVSVCMCVCIFEGVGVCVLSCMLAQQVYAICVCAHSHVLVSRCVQFVCGCASVYVLTRMFWLAQFVCVSGGGRGTHLVN